MPRDHIREFYKKGGYIKPRDDRKAAALKRVRQGYADGGASDREGGATGETLQAKLARLKREIGTVSDDSPWRGPRMVAGQLAQLPTDYLAKRLGNDPKITPAVDWIQDKAAALGSYIAGREASIDPASEDPAEAWPSRIRSLVRFGQFADGGRVGFDEGGSTSSVLPAITLKGAAKLRKLLEDIRSGAVQRLTPSADNPKVKTPLGPDLTIQGGSGVLDPTRMLYPQIYDNPKSIVEAAQKAAQPESDAMKRLFGLNRAELDERYMDDLMRRQGDYGTPILEPPGKSKGAATSAQVLNPQNAQRILDVAEEAYKVPDLKHSRSWYNFDPYWQRANELGVPLEKQRVSNQLMGIGSMMSSPKTEIMRATAADWLNNQGRFEDFAKYVNPKGEDKFRVPPDMRGVPGTVSHIQQTNLMRKLLNEGDIEFGQGTVKVPHYTAATDPDLAKRFIGNPVADSHIARQSGYSDVRTGKNAAGWGEPLSGPEFWDFAPWYNKHVAGEFNLPGNAMQALQWTAMGPTSGVKIVGPSKLELMSNQMMDAAKRLGVTPEEARDMIIRGEAGAFKRGGRVGYQTGRLVRAGAKVAGDAVEGLSDAAQAAINRIRAWHGSPHDFEKFDASKIGTGEGAQSFGHGLYFAEREGVAKSYRDALAAEGATINGVPVRDLAAQKYRLGINDAPTPAQNVADYVSSYQDNARYVMQQRAPELVPIYDEMKKTGVLKDKGHMYEVDINANPKSFLDWDKPLAEQNVWDRIHPNVRNAVDEAVENRGWNPFSAALEDYKGNELYQALRHPDVHETLPDVLPGSSWMGDTNPHKHTSAYLESLGLPGIKYLDQGSRKAGEGTRNYVVFPGSSDLVDIVSKRAKGGRVAFP